MSREYVISYDVGTSSVKAVLLDEEFNIKAISIEAYPLYHPQAGWAEQEPEDYWRAIINATKKIKKEFDFSKKDVIAIVFSCQAMGIIPFDGSQCLYRNITWLDGRGESEAARINQFLKTERYTAKSVISKILWLKNNRPDIYASAKYFLDVNSYLKYKAAGICKMERTGACSYAFDMDKLCWDQDLLGAVQIDVSKLPEIETSTHITGCLTEKAVEELGLHQGVAVIGGCNDVEAAAIGSGALKEGQGHIYLGSSAWLCASKLALPKAGNGFTVSKSPTPEEYLLKGVMQSSGMTVDKAIDLLYAKEKEETSINEFDIVEREVRSIAPGSENLIVTPWIHGETCPIATEKVRSTAFNMTNIHTRGHMVKAIREGIGYNLRWIKENMAQLYDTRFEYLNVIGGGGLSDDWMQCLADILQAPLNIMENTRHAGAIGAAVCAFVGCGRYETFETAAAVIKIRQTYWPREEFKATYSKLYEHYRGLYIQLNGAYETINTNDMEGTK